MYSYAFIHTRLHTHTHSSVVQWVQHDINRRFDSQRVGPFVLKASTKCQKPHTPPAYKYAVLQGGMADRTLN